jgi:hypothetical protein
MRIIARLIALTSLFVALNAFYSAFLFPEFAAKYADQYGQAMKIKDCDVIYLSASSNFPPTHNSEADPRKISQFVADSFPELRFEAINKPASHAALFERMIDLISTYGEARTFIVTLNMRSFGPSWIDSDLETALSQSMLFYNHRPALLNRMLLGLQAYDNLSKEERMLRVKNHWDRDPLPFAPPHDHVSDWCAEEKWGDWTHPKRQLADQFIKQYAFIITEENPRVRDVDAICNLANERGLTVVFHILAENMETAQELVGSELTGLMEQNAAWLEERYGTKGFSVVNQLKQVSADHFTDKDFPTEHYDEVGRRTIAHGITKTLREALKAHEK